MGIFNFWRSMKRVASSERIKKYWIFYAGPENYLFEKGVCDFPQKTFWSCEPETKQGDLILVYRRSMNHLSIKSLVHKFGMPEYIAKHLKGVRIGKDFPVVWEATSDAQRKFFWHWPYGCSTREIQRINPPLLLEQLKAEPRLKKWKGLRWNLQAQGHSAIEIPKFAWDIIASMI